MDENLIELRQRAFGTAASIAQWNSSNWEDLVSEALDVAFAEIERLRERLTITPEKVEAAARAGYADWDDDTFDLLTDGWQADWRAVALAALLAAGMEEPK